MSELHSHVRYCSDVVSIADVRCRSSANRLSAEEQTSVHEVVFPRAGVFVRHTGREQHVADSNHVLFFNRNEPYRVSHPVNGGDDCTSFVFSTDILLEALAFYEPQNLRPAGKTISFQSRGARSENNYSPAAATTKVERRFNSRTRSRGIGSGFTRRGCRKRLPLPSFATDATTRRDIAPLATMGGISQATDRDAARSEPVVGRDRAVRPLLPFSSGAGLSILRRFVHS